MKIMKKLIGRPISSLVLIGWMLYTAISYAKPPTIKIAVLPFGTAQWELSLLQSEQAKWQKDFTLEIRKIANPQAGKIALQAHEVDMIISDWIWVSRQRSTGSDITFVPYSTTAGSLIVPKTSDIKTIQDLKNKRLGIAGGELDKNWLMLQGLASKQSKLNLDKSVEKVFGAPPLLSQQMLTGKLDALLTYWHYAARLEVNGYRQIIDGRTLLRKLGIEQKVPTLGYVFHDKWAKKHQALVNLFLKYLQQEKNQLCQSDPAWQSILPTIKEDNPAALPLLRQRYCEGRVQQWGASEKQAAEKIYSLLRRLSSSQLTGTAEELQPGTFWPEYQH